MKRLLLTLAIGVTAHAQHAGNVHWTLTQKHTARSPERVLTLRAEIEAGWHIYGTAQPESGPMPLVLRPEPGTPFQVSGRITGTAPQKHYDNSFNLPTEYFTEAFSLTIPVTQTAPAQDGDVPLAVRYQMCSETACMPPRTVHLLAKETAS